MYTTPQKVEEFIYTEITNTFSIFSAVRDIEVRAGASNIAFDYNSVTVSSDFKGEIQYVMEFTSPTQFDLRKSERGVSRNLYVSSGDITVLFASAEFSMPAGTISGPLVLGDSIEFLIRRDVSFNNLILMIEDAETEIDSYALSERMVPWTDFVGPLFGTIPSVPRDVQLAATMWTVAFMIERRSLQQVADEGERPFSRILKNSARKKIQQAGLRLGQMGPSVVADSEADSSSAGSALSEALTDLSEDCGVTQFKDCEEVC